MKKNLLVAFSMFMSFTGENAAAMQNKIPYFSGELSNITKEMGEITAVRFVIENDSIKKAEEKIKSIASEPAKIVEIVDKVPPRGYSCCLLYSANTPSYHYIFDSLMQVDFKSRLLGNVLVNAANSAEYDVAFDKLMTQKRVDCIHEALVISANDNVFNEAYEKLINHSLTSDIYLRTAIIISKSKSLVDYSMAFNKLISCKRINDDFLISLLCETFDMSIAGGECKSAFMAVLQHDKMTDVIIRSALYKSGENRQALYDTLVGCGKINPENEGFFKLK